MKKIILFLSVSLFTLSLVAQTNFRDITYKEALAAAKAEKKLVFIDFYTSWCGPCKMMSPIVDEIAEEESEIKVCNINIDQAMEIAQKYRVMSIPTFIAFKNGEEAGRQIGAVSKGELLSLIK